MWQLRLTAPSGTERLLAKMFGRTSVSFVVFTPASLLSSFSWHFSFSVRPGLIQEEAVSGEGAKHVDKLFLGDTVRRVSCEALLAR